MFSLIKFYRKIWRNRNKIHCQTWNAICRNRFTWGSHL